jgi:glutaredoxin
MFKIYGSDQCPMCEIAKDLLYEIEAPFTYVNARELYGEEWRAIFTELSNVIPAGWRSIPMIFYGDKFIGGAKELEEYLQDNVGELDDF